jgi:hypothetical protein
MTNKMPKPAFQIILGALLLTFAVASCNGSSDTKTTTDTTTTKPADTTVAPPPHQLTLQKWIRLQQGQ